MSLFRRETLSLSEPAVAPATAKPLARSATPPVIAAGARFEGTVTGAADLLVDGDLAGNVATEGKVTVTPGGEVRGGIAARAVSIAGRVEGDVAATDLVELAASARLEGNLAASRVVIAEGAILSGQVTMTGARRP
jgi:cytoskeletal protein CcmA (bactofilin family)